jgi:serine/threonine-protein kinase
MWLFDKKKKENTDKRPNIAQLNDGCLECTKCHEILILDNYTGLSIGKCSACDTPFFVPYRVFDYWLYQPLGGGGMGSVYKALSAIEDNDQAFAVKILPRNRCHDDYLIDSLIKEAEIGKSFGPHPHLTYVDDFGECDGEYFSSMDFVEGERLDQLIDNQDSVISSKYILLWALQILSAEQHMYNAGYLYRDLKPQNVIIDKVGNAHLIDYGLCIEVEKAKQGNNSESVEGSPLYMPPERIIGAPEGMYSEIYSLGMLIFHSLARKTYYSATDAFAIARKHVTSVRFSSVETKMPGTISPKISKVIDKMISRTPESRYQTYRELGAELKQLLSEID